MYYYGNNGYYGGYNTGYQNQCCPTYGGYTSGYGIGAAIWIVLFILAHKNLSCVKILAYLLSPIIKLKLSATKSIFIA